MTFTEDLLEFLEATQPETGVDLGEAVANATAKFGARVRANKRVGKKLSPSKYLKKYGSSWQNLKNETELEGEVVQERDDSDWYKRGLPSPPKVMTKKQSVQAKKDFVKAAWERKGVTTTPVKEEVEQIAELKADTYGDYIQKAAWNAADTAARPSATSRKKELKRHDGIRKAVKLLTKKVQEEVEPLDEISKETAERAYHARDAKGRHHRSLAASTARNLLRPQENAQVRKDSQLATKHFKKADKTMWHWIKKMGETKKVDEEVEQIGELHEPTLKSYIKKSRADALKHWASSDKNAEIADKNPGPDTAKEFWRSKLDMNKVYKRSKGISNAKRSLRNKGVTEEVTLAKGTKKDKRPSPVANALPTMPAGMNAGMRMMPEEFLAEISKDTVFNAYKERYAQAKAHHTVGNKKEAKANAEKALKHADYHANHEVNQEKYAKVAAARAVIATRAKKEAPAKTEAAPEKPANKES